MRCIGIILVVLSLVTFLAVAIASSGRGRGSGSSSRIGGGCPCSASIRTAIGGRKVNTIVETSVLSNGDDHRLVVRGRVDGADTVSSSWNTGCDISSNLTVDSRSVDTLEESELLGICDGGITQSVDFFDDDMGMTDDLTLSRELLRSSKVILVRIHKVTGFQVIHVEFDRKLGVGGDGTHVGRESKLGTGHIADAGNCTDGSRVT